MGTGLNITHAFNTANTQSCAYGHDDLARIAAANCGSVWSQTFSYDAFGNITKTGSEQFQPGYNLNNQMATGASYDAMGDVLSDSLHSYAWNSDTRPTTIDTVTVTYDALGRMVEQSKSGVNTEVVYDGLGNKLALMNGTSTLVKGFGPLPAGATAVYNASGLQYYRHPDWLGSSRFSSTPSRAMYNDLAFAPFGETYAAAGSTGIGDVSFAGNNEDTTTNLYDAQFREYGIQGRWPSPDPAGFAAANPSNPQSWNRYAYTMNSPLNFVDKSGLESLPSTSWYMGYNKIGGCTADLVDTPCSAVQALLDAGAAFQCPNNDCVSYTEDQIRQNAAEQPQSPQAAVDKCEQPILDAVNDQFGTDFTTQDITGSFTNGGAVNIDITGTSANGLTPQQFNSIQTGRYTNALGYITGLGPSLHVAGPSPFDTNGAEFSNSNVGGSLSVTFTAHIDSAFAYNPIGALVHLFTDVIGHNSRNPCP